MIKRLLLLITEKGKSHSSPNLTQPSSPALNQPSSFPPHLHPLIFKILVSPPLFSVPLPFKVFSTVLLTLMQPPPALIQSINLSWVKRISKGRFYQFDCRFLSKINFPYFKSLYKQVKGYLLMRYFQIHFQTTQNDFFS